MLSRSLRLSIVAVSFAICTTAATVSAAPVQWSVNGHLYEIVLADNPSWQAARDAADLITLDGYDAHLATFTTADEQNFVAQSLAPNGNDPLWLGGYQDTAAPDFSEPSGGWRWITGEAWNTGADAPYYSFNNNAWGYAENFLITWWGNMGINDYIDNPAAYDFTASAGYVVEYTPTETGIPEPATVALTLLGLGAAFSRRRRTA